jgi:hypothetical protein
MISYAVIGRAIRVLSSNSGVQGEAWFGNDGSGGKSNLERLGSKRMGGWVPMGGVSVRGEGGTAKGSDRSSRGADVCVVQAVDEDWRLGGGRFWIRSSTTVVVEKNHAQGRQATDRRGEPTRVQQPAGLE